MECIQPPRRLKPALIESSLLRARTHSSWAHGDKTVAHTGPQSSTSVVQYKVSHSVDPSEQQCKHMFGLLLWRTKSKLLVQSLGVIRLVISRASAVAKVTATIWPTCSTYSSQWAPIVRPRPSIQSHQRAELKQKQLTSLAHRYTGNHTRRVNPSKATKLSQLIGFNDLCSDLIDNWWWWRHLLSQLKPIHLLD